MLFTGDVDEMFTKRSRNVMPKTTEQHLIVRSDRFGSEPPSVEDDVDVWCYAIVSCMPETTSDKSVAFVTNNTRLHSAFCTVEAKLLTDLKHRTASL